MFPLSSHTKGPLSPRPSNLCFSLFNVLYFLHWMPQSEIVISIMCWCLVFWLISKLIIKLFFKAQIFTAALSKMTRFFQTILLTSALWLSHLLYLTPWQLFEVEFLLQSTGSFARPDLITQQQLFNDWDMKLLLDDKSFIGEKTEQSDVNTFVMALQSTINKAGCKTQWISSTISRKFV